MQRKKAFLVTEGDILLGENKTATVAEQLERGTTMIDFRRAKLNFATHGSQDLVEGSGALDAGS